MSKADPGKTGDPGPEQNSDMVITPAGPAPRDKVREVGPDEMVRRDADGTLRVVPRPKS